MIEIKALSYRYRSAESGSSLTDINLKIESGECVLLCGKSGSGKTTITRLLNGIIPNLYEGQIAGEIYLDGENLLQMPMYAISKKVGSVFQNPRTQFYTVDTTSEIAFGCENYGLEPAEIRARLRRAAADLAIEPLLNRNIFQLSGGEKQMIAFASIYAMSPQVYVLDEPSSNLDARAINFLRRTIALLKRQGKTIIIAEHRIYYLKDLVDRAIYLDGGKIAKHFTMQALSELTLQEQLQYGLRTVDLYNYPLQSRAVPRAANFFEIENMRFSLGGKEVLQIDHLKLPAGRITALIGRNGAGKSTFLSCLCGLYKKAKGRLSKDGKSVTAKAMLKESYIVMQEVNHQLFAESVRAEIALGAADNSPRDIAELTRLLDIDDLAERHPATLSGGQKQRVIIANAMLCGKKVLCFDEPTSGLDYAHMMQICQLLKTLRAPDLYIFIITHDYELIASACDDVIHLEDGKIKAQYDLNENGVSDLRRFFDSQN